MLSIRTIAVALFILLSGCTPSLEQDINSGDDVVIPPDTDINNTEWDDCSGRIGDHPCDFTYINQHGNGWTLYDHIGSTIVIDFSAVWCVACQHAAVHVQEYQDHYTDLGYDFIWVTILIDDVNHDTVELEEIQEWANVYGMTSAPVLAGSRDIIDLSAENGFPLSSWPTFIVVNSEMITSHGLHGWSEATVLSWVEEELGI